MSAARIAILAGFAAALAGADERIVAGPDEPHGDARSAAQRIWELPAIDVTGDATPREQDAIAPSGQPRWTARRRFLTTRVYVVPDGHVALEAWWLRRGGRDAPDETVTQFELETGLPHRLQLDVMQQFSKTGADGDQRVSATGFEGDWALADWGVLPGNPTLEVEYEAVGGGPDELEARLLLGDDLVRRVYWGVNVGVEHALGHAAGDDYEAMAAIAWGWDERDLSLGVESVVRSELEDDERELEASLGPSAQWRASPMLHLMGAVLFGVTEAAPRTTVTMVAAWEF